MFPGQAEDALNQADGAHAALGERRVGPLVERRADARAAAEQLREEGLLARRGLGGPPGRASARTGRRARARAR